MKGRLRHWHRSRGLEPHHYLVLPSPTMLKELTGWRDFLSFGHVRSTKTASLSPLESVTLEARKGAPS